VTENNGSKPIVKSRLRRWIQNIVLILIGVALAAALLEGVFRLFPNLIPDGRARAVDLGKVKFTVGIGDLFVYRNGVIAPPPNPYDVLSEHTLKWDDDGFRVPAKPADHYDIIALGDSYTEAANTALPWSDVLAQQIGQPVRNMGFRGYGPVEESIVLKNYGMKLNPKLIIVGFFEGNDLPDADSSQSRNNFILPKVARQSVPAFDPSKTIWQTDKQGPFQFPVRVSINDVTRDMAFLDTYLSWLNGDYNTFANSGTLSNVGQIWQEMKQTAGNACVVVAYFPSTPHIYAPYIVPEDRAKLMSTVYYLSIPQPGVPIQLTNIGSSTYEQTMARLDNQRDAMAKLAEAQGVPFIDLTPAFQKAAASGQFLYYNYDTHWNQAGHNLAGQTIAAYLALHPNPCVK